MEPKKEKIILHLSDKMTNQDIANIYGTTFQKIIYLIKKYELNPNELRKVNKYTVYEHWHHGKVVYVGSGVWYRCRRYKNRRNSEHVHLMESGKLEYRIVGEYEKVEDARKYEAVLIQKYKQLGQAKFNKKMH
ncbi:hypothetical protein IOC57_03230 [Bacillus sp. SD075]|uniref:hypothetical protein n=1 Tax=Bacillus sp. SD075 TaxID=2781732 RepID=UPI001A971884|nr:hypothetical protein [Bacillus sp. SD075]MBO0996775.1 hypothetical protein [Bacillus sp. SD075]